MAYPSERGGRKYRHGGASRKTGLHLWFGRVTYRHVHNILGLQGRTESGTFSSVYHHSQARENIYFMGKMSHATGFRVSRLYLQQTATLAMETRINTTISPL